MLNLTAVHAWSPCYGRDLKQKFPFFSEAQVQNKDDLKNLCIDLNKILLRLCQLTCTSQVHLLVLSPRLKLSRHVCELAVSMCTKATFLSKTCPLFLAFWHAWIYPAWMFTVLLCYNWTSIIFNKKETNSIQAGMQLNFSVTMWTQKTWKEQQLWKDHAVTDKHSGSCPVKFWGLTSGSFRLSYSNDSRRVALLGHVEVLVEKPS